MLTDKKKLVFVCLSALMSSLPFSFPNLFFLTLIFPSLFFFVLNKEESSKKSFLYSFLFSLIYYLGVHYYFIALYPLDFAGLSNIASLGVVLVGWVGISLFQGAELSLFLFLYKKLSPKSSSLSPFLLAFLFALCEYVQSLGFLGFPWGMLSLTQYKFLPFIQSLSLFGANFLTFLIVLVNALFAQGFSSKKKAPFVLALTLLFTNTLFGAVRLNISEPTGESIKASVVQPSILSYEKWSGANSLDTHITLSEEISDTDLILWPETAIASQLVGVDYKTEKIKSLLDEKDCTLITGAFHDEKDSTYNAAVCFDGENVSVYKKQHLVPFGEYVPARDVLEICLPFLTDINMLSYDLSSGKESTVFKTSNGNIGTLVCFDSIFPSLARNSAKGDAELLCIITNDSWYKDSTALYHHNAQAVFRAVENNRFVVRCANSGVSSFIDSRGRIMYLSAPYEVVTHTQEVKLIRDKSLYTLTGNIFPIISLAFIAVFTAIKKKKQI